MDFKELAALILQNAGGAGNTNTLSPNVSQVCKEVLSLGEKNSFE